MAYVYILKSLKDGNLYTGSTVDLKKRLHDHNIGRNKSTRYRRPLKLVYYEVYPTLIEARLREKELKTVEGGKQKQKLIESFPQELLKPFEE
jgi:putative endonuclease